MRHKTLFAAMALLLSLLTAATTWAKTVKYIDADGIEREEVATVLTGSETANKDGSIGLLPGWYVVENTNPNGVDVTFTARIIGSGWAGTINIILADGAEMVAKEIALTGAYINDVYTTSPRFDLAIYGQSAGTGRLTVSNSSFQAIHTNGNITINGGIINATPNNNSTAIYAEGNSITINGGQVTAIGGSSGRGISASNNGTITLNLHNPNDRVYANSYNHDNAIIIPEGKYLKDNYNYVYTGTVNVSMIDDVTLRPITQTEYIQARLGAGRDGSPEHPYTISNNEGWEAFCLALEDNTTWNGFSGKTVVLNKDINASRCAGSGTGESTATNEHPFRGTFLGQGYKIKCQYGWPNTPLNDDYIAPFRYVKDATISGLVVEGYTYTLHEHAAGIVGLACGSTTISDCRSSINIVSSINGNGSHGGILACAWTDSNVNIEGCIFNGSIKSASGYNTNQCGGFVGWRNGTVHVCNSLFSPSQITIGSDGDEPSATFVRHNGNVDNITNCYYTVALGTAQGKSVHTVAAGTDVTIDAIELTGTPTTYTRSGITAYSGGGLVLGTDIYYGSGDEVSLTLGITAGDTPLGYQFGYLASTGTLTGTTLTMPDADVTISVDSRLYSTSEAVSVDYIDESGQPQTAQAIALDGTETNLGAGNYFVGIDISYSSWVSLDGDSNVSIILCDDKTMTVSASNSMGISGPSSTLTLYGQSGGSGELSSNAQISVKNLNMNGGRLTSSQRISGSGSITFNGGAFNIEEIADMSVTLNYTHATDNVKINKTAALSTVTVQNTKAFTDGTKTYTGQLTQAEINGLAGKTLRPCFSSGLSAASATLLDEPKHITTFYSGTVDYQLPDGAKAYTVGKDGSKMVFHLIGEDGRVIPHGTAAIIVADAASFQMTSTITTLTAPASNILQGSDVDTPKPAGTVYVLGIVNEKLGFYQLEGNTIPAGKAYYVVE